MNYPVIMGDTIASLVPSTIRGLADERALENRTDKTLRIRELRFRLGQAGSPNEDTFVFGDIAVQMRLGNNPLTSGFVPLSAMVWAADISVNKEDLAPSIPYLVRFAKPVLLAPGEQISLQVQHMDLQGSGAGGVNTFVEVFAFCEEADPLQSHFMPWMAAYRTPMHIDGNGAFLDASTEADLMNPFDDEMLVERFIGRVFAAGNVIYGGNGSRILLYDKVRIRIDDHKSTQIVRDPAPMGLVFDTTTRSWAVNAMLDAKGYYRVSIDSNLSGGVLLGPLAGANVYSVVGMLGYRAVR